MLARLFYFGKFAQIIRKGERHSPPRESRESPGAFIMDDEQVFNLRTSYLTL